jgi:transposase
LIEGTLDRGFRQKQLSIFGLTAQHFWYINLTTKGGVSAMTLNPAIKVDLPKGVVIYGKNNYVYHTLRSYRNESGEPRNDRVVIGRLDSESGRLIPNNRYWEIYGAIDDAEAIIEYESDRAVGASFLVGHLLRVLGLSEVLDASLGVERSKVVQTAALYMLARNNVFDHVRVFCEGYTFNEAPLTSQTASKLFSSITHDEKMSFFKLWILKQELVGQYLAYDVTSFSTYAKKISKSEFGYNRDKERLSQINLGCFLSEKTSMPLFYVTYPGSITDNSHLQYMMAYNKDLEISNIGFILDKGFCSTKNISYLAQNNIDFIIAINKFHKTANETIDICRTNLTTLDYKIEHNTYGKSKYGCYYGIKANMHVYYDTKLFDFQINRLEESIKSIEEKLNKLKKLKKLSNSEEVKYNAYFNINKLDDGSFIFKRDSEKINFATRNCGFFCLLTNKKVGSAKTLKIYRRRDVIEKFYDDIKNFMQMKRLRTHNGDTTEGKLFCAFIGLIVASAIEEKLHKFLNDKSWSKNNLIEELEKIHIITTKTGQRLMNPLTKTQRTIFEYFGLTEKDLVAYVDGERPKPSGDHLKFGRRKPQAL